MVTHEDMQNGWWGWVSGWIQLISAKWILFVSWPMENMQGISGSISVVVRAEQTLISGYVRIYTLCLFSAPWNLHKRSFSMQELNLVNVYHCRCIISSLRCLLSSAEQPPTQHPTHFLALWSIHWSTEVLMSMILFWILKTGFLNKWKEHPKAINNYAQHFWVLGSKLKATLLLNICLISHSDLSLVGNQTRTVPAIALAIHGTLLWVDMLQTAWTFLSNHDPQWSKSSWYLVTLSMSNRHLMLNDMIKTTNYSYFVEVQQIRCVEHNLIVGIHLTCFVQIPSQCLSLKPALHLRFQLATPDFLGAVRLQEVMGKERRGHREQMSFDAVSHLHLLK